VKVKGTTMAIGIAGTGSYLPERVVSNEELVTWVPGATTEWIERKTHIKARRYADDDQAASDLAVRAARRALEAAAIEAGQPGFVIVSTSTGDQPQPPTACRVQHDTGSASVPVTLDAAVRSGAVRGGDLVLLSGFGGGMSTGTCLLRWTA
jgi:3-oxoacyl-[acyl-carrier-protein] synthase III